MAAHNTTETVIVEKIHAQTYSESRTHWGTT